MPLARQVKKVTRKLGRRTLFDLPEDADAKTYSIYLADAFEWLAQADPCCIHAVVTDPPYGLLEYTPEQLEKMRNGNGGVWRIPPAFDGCKRRPLPRFTVLSEKHREDPSARSTGKTCESSSRAWRKA